MKHRTKQRIKRLLPKIGKWSLWIAIAASLLFITINSYIRLHNGEPVQDVDGRKYAPVVSELIWMTVAGVALVFGLKFFTKLKVVYVLLIAIGLLVLIGLFGYWSFSYTHQDPVEGFLTVGVIVGSVSLFTAIALWYERYARRNKKKKEVLNNL